ncbi:hypothetical protein NJG16_02230 [Stenotrophomonas maltophilia]|nr:hypothetical protein [Stenotrophomonas maltophilia]
MTTDKTPATLDAVRNLIVCDTQFTWAGVTNLSMPQMMDLQARGWVVEGDSNDEFQLTEAGEAVVARALEHGAPATLATVKHGGCVQLRDWHSLAEHITDHLCANDYDIGGRPELLVCVVEAIASDTRARFEAWARLNGHTLTRSADGEYCFISVRNLWTSWQAALSAQPSPGGQGDVHSPLSVYVDSYRRMAKMGDGRVSCIDVAFDIEHNMSHALVARQPGVQMPVGTIRDRKGAFAIELTELAHDTDAGALDGLDVYLAARQPVGEPLTETRRNAVEFFTANPTLAELYMRQHLDLPESEDDAASEAFAEFADDYLTDGNGYAPASTYEACGNAFKAAWPDRVAATAAARAELKRLHGDDRTVGARRAEALNRADARDDAEDDAPPAQQLGQPVGELVISDLSGYAVAASQVRRGYDVECGRCGKFCDEGPGPCQPAQAVDFGAVIAEAIGCFDAATSEGWVEALAEGDIERIRDLWSRRIEFAYGALIDSKGVAK